MKDFKETHPVGSWWRIPKRLRISSSKEEIYQILAYLNDTRLRVRFQNGEVCEWNIDSCCFDEPDKNFTQALQDIVERGPGSD